MVVEAIKVGIPNSQPTLVFTCNIMELVIQLRMPMCRLLFWENWRGRRRRYIPHPIILIFNYGSNLQENIEADKYYGVPAGNLSGMLRWEANHLQALWWKKVNYSYSLCMHLTMYWPKIIDLKMVIWDQAIFMDNWSHLVVSPGECSKFHSLPPV